jgi:hypothetical protein
MIWEFDSPKYSKHQVLVDDEFDYLRNEYYWYLWGSSRHHTLYVVGQKRDDKSGKCYRLHRVITKAKLDDVVDHKNGNGLDNRLENLRVTNSTGNNRNARKRKNSTSKYKGVSKKDNSYTVQIQISKDKYKFKSGIKSEEEAARLYNEWAIKYHGEFAVLNKIE